MKSRIAVLGAGFGGLELSTLLSEALGDQVDVTLIVKSDAFVFGYSKLDVLFGRTTLDAERLPYRDFVKPGVRFLQQTIRAIDPQARRVSTDAGAFDSDFLVVALGADYDAGATPGMVEGINEFYSVAGANHLRGVLPGFSKGRNLEKLGMHAQDTSELFFQDIELTGEARLGAEGQGFILLMKELAWERLQIAIGGIASAEAALQSTIDYVRQRKVFGQAVLDFQTTKHKLAEMKTEIHIGRIFVDRCLQQMMDSELDPTTAAMAKYWVTDLQCKVIDQCLQLHGGYGYMMEYPITRAYADARVQRIYGGTNEIMKELIARTL